MIHGCCINIMQETLSVFCIRRYDTFGMLGAVLCNVLHGFLQAGYNPDIQNVVVILCRIVFFANWLGRRDNTSHSIATF
ncbi:hypothetical protein D3C75_1276560 [compost metagenome]